MDDALLVRMLHAVAQLEEQFEAVAKRQPVAVAVLRDGLAAHVLHGEVRTSFRRAPAVEDPGDRRVIHQCQRLTLGVEPRQDLGGVHSGLYDLDGDLAADRARLFGEPDLTHSAFAETLEQLIGTERRGLGETRGRCAGAGPIAVVGRRHAPAMLPRRARFCARLPQG
jgi:hypothetical protein